MLNQEEIDKINILAKDVFNGQHNELEKWMEEPSYIDHSKFLLDYPNVPFYAGFYAIQVLQFHVGRSFDAWAFDSQIEFVQWYSDLVFNQNLLIISNDTLLSLYSKLFGIVFSKGWNLDSRFQFIFDGFIEKVKSIPPSHALLACITEITDSMNKNKIASFQENYLSPLFHYSFTSLSNSMNDQKTVFFALQAIETMLEFNPKKNEKNEDITRLSTEIHPSYAKMILCEETANLIINVSQQHYPEKCIEILTLTLTANNQVVPTEIYIKYLQTLVNFTFFNFVNTSSFHQFTGFLYCLKKNIDINFVGNGIPFPFQQFAKGAFDFTMNYLKSEHILTDLNGIYNLLLFWETYSDIGDVDICFYQLTIIQAFVDASFNALIDDQETAIENFGLLSSSIPQVFIPIRGISKTMLPEILNTSILPYFERISEHYASLQVSFLCNLLLSIIISTNIPIKTSNEADANKIVNSISQLYTTVINVYKDHLSEEYIINSFILFLRHFSKCKYLSESSTISNKVYYQLSETTGIPSIMELLNFLFNSLWNLFYNITQPNLIYESSKALTTLFDPKSTFFTYVIKLPTVQQLIQIRVEKPFPFLQSFEHSRSRVIFHKSLSSILFRDMKVLCKQYLHTYDNIIENHTNLWCFLRDFTGFFEACKTIDEYKTIFNYVFNNHLAKLIEVIPHIIQIPFVVNSLLKMWIVMLKNELINKCFDHHSINGLMLFHYSVDLITKLLDNLSDQIRLDNQQNIKFINYCLNIIYYIVASNYVPFNAIEIFNDDSLERLIVSFVKCITTVIPINEIKFYPKVELILQNLNLCFCIRHFNTVCKVNCNELSFIIIDVGLKSLNNKTQEKAINTLMYQIRNKKISAENKMLFTITFTLFDLILNLNGNTTELKFCLMEILRYFPICVQEIKNKIENAVIVEKREMFWNEFNGFVAACKEMFDSNNTTKFVEVIDNLMMHMRMCLSSVAYAFK